jgi:DNA repair exonuclease SbcCD ATPase subunit
MKKNEFRTPLIQSAAVLGGVLILFAIVASSEASSAGGGILAIIFGIGNLILFFIGMGIALLFSITLLIAIFLAAVAMVDSEQASKMYSDLKKNFTLIALSLNKQYCENITSDTFISKEEYDRMKQEIVELQERNSILQGNIKGLTGDNVLLQGTVDKLRGENSGLKEKIEDLSLAVENLQSSEIEIKNLVEKLTEKIQAGADLELKNQIKRLEQLHDDTHTKIEVLMGRLKTLESNIKPTQLSGIFAYIGKAEEQSLFIQKVQEALSQDMTYAQIDDYLIDNLPPELLKTIKDHPVLTKNYIRSLRTE